MKTTLEYETFPSYQLVQVIKDCKLLLIRVKQEDLQNKLKYTIQTIKHILINRQVIK